MPGTINSWIQYSPEVALRIVFFIEINTEIWSMKSRNASTSFWLFEGALFRGGRSDQLEEFSRSLIVSPLLLEQKPFRDVRCVEEVLSLPGRSEQVNSKELGHLELAEGGEDRGDHERQFPIGSVNGSNHRPPVRSNSRRATRVEMPDPPFQ